MHTQDCQNNYGEGSCNGKQVILCCIKYIYNTNNTLTLILLKLVKFKIAQPPFLVKFVSISIVFDSFQGMHHHTLGEEMKREKSFGTQIPNSQVLTTYAAKERLVNFLSLALNSK